MNLLKIVCVWYLIDSGVKNGGGQIRTVWHGLGDKQKSNLFVVCLVILFAFVGNLDEIWQLGFVVNWSAKFVELFLLCISFVYQNIRFEREEIDKERKLMKGLMRWSYECKGLYFLVQIPSISQVCVLPKLFKLWLSLMIRSTSFPISQITVYVFDYLVSGVTLWLTPILMPSLASLWIHIKIGNKQIQ